MANKPMELKLINGNYTKEQIEHTKAQEEKLKPKTDKLSCPSWVKDKIARKEYSRILKELKEMDLVSNLDINILANYCIAYSMHREVTEALTDEPLIVEKETKMGKQMIENPLIKIQLKYSAEMDKLGTKLGLDILSRLKMVKPKVPEKPANKFTKFSSDKK